MTREEVYEIINGQLSVMKREETLKRLIDKKKRSMENGTINTINDTTSSNSRGEHFEFIFKDEETKRIAEQSTSDNP